MSVQNKFENLSNNLILWQILEFLSNGTKIFIYFSYKIINLLQNSLLLDENSLNKCSPIIRSILASVIIQWDSYQEQSTRNIPKTLSITLKLLNTIVS